MRFESTEFLFALPVLLVIVVWTLTRSYAQLENWSRWASLLIRVLVLVLCVGAISRPYIQKQDVPQHVVFVLDISPSVAVENIRDAAGSITKIIESAKEENSDAVFSLVAFGESARLIRDAESDWDAPSEEFLVNATYRESLPQLFQERTANTNGETDIDRKIESVKDFKDNVAGHDTNIVEAIRLALNCGPTDYRRSVLLYTDAQFHQRRWTSAWRDAESSNVPLRTVLLDKSPGPEIGIASVDLPVAVRIHEGFAAQVSFQSSIETDARLQVFQDGFLFHDQPVSLKPGVNLVEVGGLAFEEKGFHSVKAVIRGPKDTHLENNEAKSLVVVPGEARVLYIDGNESQMAYLTSALQLQGMQVEPRPATGIPQDLHELLSFDAFVLSNVPSDQISMRQMRMIQSYVRDFGGGFMMLGGDESFGLGGYFQTPLEETLPVRMPVKKELTRPSLAIALVIDKSGSMTGVKIQLAKSAALATAEVIHPRDLITVVGFDGQSQVILDLTPAGDRATVTSHISTLDAGGGTFLQPALQDAYDKLLDSGAKRKHVIILSDGITQGFGYEDMASTMAADAITVSTVGIGADADVRLLEAIATAGNGETYFTNDFYSIPQIFTREAMRASNSMLVERLVEPLVVGHDSCLDGIDTEVLPMLTGYVATTPKGAANLIMSTDAGDPLLAKWRYGLGHAAAFTSETKPRWAEDWIEWEDFAKLFGQLVRSIGGRDLDSRFVMLKSHERDGNSVTLKADLRTTDGEFLSSADVTLASIGDSGQATQVPVTQTGAGLFEGTLPATEFGKEQRFVWNVETEDQVEETETYAMIFPFSAEYRSVGVGKKNVDAITDRLDGTVTSISDVSWNPVTATSAGWRPIWPALLVAAILLVPFDILVRRLG